MGKRLTIVWLGVTLGLLGLFAMHVYFAWEYQLAQQNIEKLEAELERTRLVYNEKVLSLAVKKYNTRKLLYQKVLSGDLSAFFTETEESTSND